MNEAIDILDEEIEGLRQTIAKNSADLEALMERREAIIAGNVKQPAGAVLIDEVEALIGGVDPIQRPCNSGWFITTDVDFSTLSSEDVLDARTNLHYRLFYKRLWASSFAHRQTSEDTRKMKCFRAANYERDGNRPFIVSDLSTLDGEPIYVYPGTREELIAEMRKWREDYDRLGPAHYPAHDAPFDI